MEELTDSIQRQNLRIMAIEEGEEMQANGMHNILDKIKTENFQNIKKLCSSSYRELLEHQTDLTKI
jgi:hypothetical protein